MLITYKTINKITFPVYKIPNSNWEFIDGLLFIDNILVDDRNMSGDSLGKRRLQTPFKNLLVLNRSINSLVGILKQTSYNFIDSKGIPFIYEKTIFCKLIYHKIKKIDKKDRASILWLYNIQIPFIVPRPPKDGYVWVGILYLKGFPWLLYNYSQESLKSTRKKV